MFCTVLPATARLSDTNLAFRMRSESVILIAPIVYSCETVKCEHFIQFRTALLFLPSFPYVTVVG